MTITERPGLGHVIGAGGLLAVSLRDGDLRLRAVDGDEVRIRDRGDRALDREVTIERGDGSVAIKAGRWLDIGGSHGGADLDIDVPRGATVVIEGASTDIAADGLTGDQRYRSASGDVTLRGTTGRVDVETVSGDVDITATGETAMTIRAVSGDIGIRAGTLRSLEVSTTSGDIKIAGRLAGDGPFRLQTVSGDALIAPAGDVQIEMTTVAGDLHADVGSVIDGRRGRRSIAVGQGGPSLSFRSMSGDLRVVRATPITTNPAHVESVEPAKPAEPAEPTEPTEPVEPVQPIDSEPAEPLAPIAGAGDDTERVPVVWPSDATPAVPGDDDPRLTILRALERGEIDVAEAGRRLEALDTEAHDA